MKHDQSGHMAAQKTRTLVQREYYWLSMHDDVAKYCQTCSVCASCKDSPSKSKTELTFTSQPQEPWQQVAMDLKGPIGPQLTPRGNRHLLVVVDLLTRSAEMIPLPNKSAKTVANALVNEVFCRHGIPDSILTDRGLEFDNSTMQTLATELGIDKMRISPLHTQANGAVERLNRTIGQMLKKSANCDDLDWDLNIPFVRFSYQIQEHSATGHSPFYLTYGRHPRTPALANGGKLPRAQVPQDWSIELAKRLKDAHAESVATDTENKERRTEKSKKEATTAVKYKIRDKVLVHTPQRKGKASALHKPWAGPYIVIESREGNTYRLKKADNFRKRIIRHADQIRPIHPRPPRLQQRIENTQVDPKSNGEQTLDPKPVCNQPNDHTGEEHSENRGERETEEPGRGQRVRRAPQRFGDWTYSSEDVMLLYSDIVSYAAFSRVRGFLPTNRLLTATTHSIPIVST